LIDVYACMRLNWLWPSVVFLVFSWLVYANSGGTWDSRPSEQVLPKREYQEPSLVLVHVVAQAKSSRFEREAISLRRWGLD